MRGADENCIHDESEGQEPHKRLRENVSEMK
jgi:hypothetical protein